MSGEPNPDQVRREYTDKEVKAAYMVLAELAELLDEYRDGIVLIGGWVPYFAIPDPEVPHEGTKDVDLALNAISLQFDGDETIEEILSKALYQQDTVKAFRWYRTVEITETPIRVVVDFLADERGTYKNGQLQKIQDIHVSTMHGCSAAFTEPVEVVLNAAMPDGASVSRTIKMASIPQFIAMKGLAFHNRDAQAQKNSDQDEDARKDAYDIYFIVKNYPGGIAALAEIIKPHLGESILTESLQKIAAKWQHIGDRGPALIAKKENEQVERRRLQRDVFEQVYSLLNRLGIIDSPPSS